MPRIKGRRPEDTRDKVLLSARHIFAERGYESATLALIAEHAGVTAATLPYHFTDKQGLWDAVVEVFYADMFAFAQGLRPEAGLRTQLEQIYDWALLNRDGIRVIVRKIIESGSIDPTVREVRMASAYTLVSQLVRRRYEVNETQARNAAIAVTHLLTRFITNSTPDNLSTFNVSDEKALRMRVIEVLFVTACALLGLDSSKA